MIRRVQPLHLLPTDRYLRFGTKALGGTLVRAVFEDGVDHQAQSSRFGCDIRLIEESVLTLQL